MKFSGFALLLVLLMSCATTAPVPKEESRQVVQAEATEFRQLHALYEEYQTFMDDPIYLREGFSANFIKADWIDRVQVVPQLLDCSDEGSNLLMSWAMVVRRQGMESAAARKLHGLFNTYMSGIQYREDLFAKNRTRIALIVSGDTQGVLEAQSSSSGPVGGFPRRLSAITLLRSVNPGMFLLDAGDVFSSDPAAAQNNVMLLHSMNQAGYDAIGLGPHDFSLGMGPLRRLASLAKCPLVCSNLPITEAAATFIKPYVILNRNGLRVAVLALCPPVHSAGLNAEFVLPEKALARFVGEVKAKCDAIVLLTQYRQVELADVLRKYPEIQAVFEDAGAMAANTRIAGQLSMGRGLRKTVLVRDPDGSFRSTDKQPAVLEIVRSGGLTVQP